MNISGTLKKRRRRNLSKVNGLTTIPYNEITDSFNKADDPDLHLQRPLSGLSTSFSGKHIAVRLNKAELLQLRRSSTASSKKRITRNPSFHAIHVTQNIDQDAEAISEEPKVKSGSNSDCPSHLLSSRIIQRLREMVIAGAIFGLFPWKWNDKRRQIERRSAGFVKLWSWFLLFCTVQSIGLEVYQCQVFYHNFYSKDIPNRTVFMGFMGLLWNGYTIGKNIAVYFYEERTRKYINALLEFNKDHVEKYLIHLDGYEYRGNILVHPIFVVLYVDQVISSTSLFLKKPFLPWFLFSFIYPKPWYWLIPGAFHQLVMIAQIVIYFSFVPVIVIIHANTLRFWLREIHNNNDSDYTSEDLRTPTNALETYNALGVLNRLFNECMSPLAIPVTKMVWASALVPAGYVMIRSANHLFIEDFPSILSYPATILSCSIKAFLLLCLSAEVSDLGVSFLDSWSQTQDKNFRRILMSCPTLQVWTRRFYCITVSTTIKFFQEVFNVITNCVITFP